MSELKPCPFCGGEAKLWKTPRALGWKWNVQCHKCGVRSRLDEEMSTILLWNNRPIEDALRWRKYPEEKPEIDGTYLIATEGFPIRLMAWDNTAQRWFCLPKGEIYYWLPIPPLKEK